MKDFWSWLVPFTSTSWLSEYVTPTFIHLFISHVSPLHSTPPGISILLSLSFYQSLHPTLLLHSPSYHQFSHHLHLHILLLYPIPHSPPSDPASPPSSPFSSSQPSPLHSYTSTLVSPPQTSTPLSPQPRPSFTRHTPRMTEMRNYPAIKLSLFSAHYRTPHHAFSLSLPWLPPVYRRSEATTHSEASWYIFSITLIKKTPDFEALDLISSEYLYRISKADNLRENVVFFVCVTINWET